MDELNREDCVLILRSFLNDSSTKFISFDIKPHPSSSEGLLGAHYLLEIKYEVKNIIRQHRFFVKTPPADAAQAEFASELISGGKEYFFYGVLYSEFRRLDLPVDFAPKPYHSQSNNNLLVIEDLALRNYSLNGKQNFFNIGQIKSAVRALAMMHSSGFIYEKMTSHNLLRKYSDYLVENLYSVKYGRDGFMYKHIKAALSCFGKLKDYRELVKELEGMDVFAAFHSELDYARTLCHGDLWSNNVMFDPGSGCKIIDYQMIRYHYPAFDVLSLVYFNTNASFRRRYIDDVFDYYYSSAAQFLADKGYSIDDFLPADHFKGSLDYFQFLARFQALCGRSLTFLPVDVLEQYSNRVTAEEFLFKYRTDIFIDAFSRFEKYREIVTDDLDDLKAFMKRN